MIVWCVWPCMIKLAVSSSIESSESDAKLKARKFWRIDVMTAPFRTRVDRRVVEERLDALGIGFSSEAWSVCIDIDEDVERSLPVVFVEWKRGEASGWICSNSSGVGSKTSLRMSWREWRREVRISWFDFWEAAASFTRESATWELTEEE